MIYDKKEEEVTRMRKFACVLPKIDDTGNYEQFRPVFENDSMLYQYENDVHESITTLHNCMPYWSKLKNM